MNERMDKLEKVLDEMKQALDENDPEKVLELYKKGHEILHLPSEKEDLTENKWKEEYLQLPYHVRNPAPYGEDIYFAACRKRQKECPFCHKDNFDLIGLKMHIKRGWCGVWERIK